LTEVLLAAGEPVRAFRPLAFDALVLGARYALTIDVRGPVDSRLALLTLDALSLLRTRHALRPFDPLRALGTNLTLLTFHTRCAFDACLALHTLGALSTLRTLRALCPLTLAALTAMLAIWLCTGRG